MNCTLEKIRLELKVNWKISRNESLYKENFILKCGEYASEVAPNIRYGESCERIEKEFSEFQANPKYVSPEWCNSFKNAVNNLLLKMRTQGQIYQELSLNPVKKIITSFSIPIMDVTQLKDYLKRNEQFGIYKLKVAGLEHIALLKELSSLTDKKIRVDGNEGFKSLDEYLQFEKQTEGMNIEFIEQPFASSMIETYQKLKPISRYEIIADESVETDFCEKLFATKFHGVNIKLMKAGGIENGRQLLLKAKQQGLKTMIGCMIESSLGISEAFYLAELCDYFDLDGSLLISNDPYQNLLSLDGEYLCLN